MKDHGPAWSCLGGWTRSCFHLYGNISFPWVFFDSRFGKFAPHLKAISCIPASLVMQAEWSLSSKVMKATYLRLREGANMMASRKVKAVLVGGYNEAITRHLEDNTQRWL